MELIKVLYSVILNIVQITNLRGRIYATLFYSLVKLTNKTWTNNEKKLVSILYVEIKIIHSFVNKTAIRA